MFTRNLLGALGVLLFGVTAACGNSGSGGNAATGGSGGTAGSGGSATGGSGGSATGGSGGSATGGSAGTGGSGGSSGSSGTAGSGGSAGSGSTDIPGGGTVLFEEHFDDTQFKNRGWYDGSGSVTTSEHAPGSTSAFECAFATGAQHCTGGTPARHKITATPTVYLSFWIKFSTNWVGSGKAYHPHMFHFINDLESDYVGPSFTHLTTYTEIVANKAQLSLQDSENVDLNCILKNDNTFVGCNGDFKSYKFTENRSICSCNGVQGDVQGHDCYSNGDGTWSSDRSWWSSNAFVDAQGPNYKSDWHHVEVYFAMNSIQGGVAVPDGKIRWVQDGKTLISHDKILMRSGAHPSMKFNQFAMLPYIGDGSPIAQTFWVDDMVVATARP